MAHADAATLDSALLDRQAWIERASRRWHLLLHGATLAFIVMLYSNPQFWWPSFEKFRLAFATMAVGAFALVMHRVTSGERIRLGGPGVFPLLAYLSFIPLSLAWTLSAPDTLAATFEAAKMAVVFVVVQAAVDGPRRLRRFMLVGTLASLGPALGGHPTCGAPTTRSSTDSGRTGAGRTPTRTGSRCASSPCCRSRSTAPSPRGSAGCESSSPRRSPRTSRRSCSPTRAPARWRRRWRSGCSSSAGGSLTPARKLGAAAVIALGLLAFAPTSFWQRQATIAEYETDVSVAGRENAWKVLGVIVEERPFTGVGASAFIQAWGRYAPLEAGGRRYVAHNVLLEIVGELGIVAFGLFCAFIAWLLPKLWRAGSDPLVGTEARAIFAALAGYLVIEMANGYSLSWFLYFLFACGLVTIRLSRARAALGTELPPWATR